MSKLYLFQVLISIIGFIGLFILNYFDSLDILKIKFWGGLIDNFRFNICRGTDFYNACVDVFKQTGSCIYKDLYYLHEQVIKLGDILRRI